MSSRSERFTCDRLKGVHLHALHWGSESDPKLVLLHGGGANAHWWDHMAPELARSFHVVALDFRAHGDSDYPENLERGSFEEDLWALLEHLQTPDAVLIGHSMGGNIAIVHAEHARRSRGLVLLDVASGASPRARRVASRALTIRHSYPSREDAIERFRFVPPAVHVEESLREAIAAHSVHEERDGRFGFKADPRWIKAVPAMPESLAEIQCPTLLVRGVESSLCSEEGAHALVSELPHGRLATIPRAGHHVHIDRPKDTLRAIRGFLHELR